MNKKENTYRFLFYFIWFCLLVIQASFTDLLDDEAYYWVYSQHLSLGYFDHPPMIALMIKAGYSIFQNELGVRLFSIIACMLSIFIIEKTLIKSNFLLFTAIVSSIFIAQLGGFIAAPDSPYILFTSLFVFQFRKFLSNPNVIQSIILGIIAAGVLYSKYHGAMIFLFLGITHLRLLKKPHIYIALMIGVLCYLPHFIWLYKNDFPSFQYHFIDRNVQPYSIKHTLLYLLGQFGIYGPITSIFIFYALFKFKKTNDFTRAIKYLAIGVFSFLFFFSFKGTIEANWSLGIFSIVIIITHEVLNNHDKIRKIFFYTVPLSLILILSLRIFLVYDFSGGLIKGNEDFHNKKEWANEISKLAKNKPVVFINSYQKTSIYSFYTHNMAVSMNNLHGRKNQFEFLPILDSLQGKKVLVVANWEAPETQSYFYRDKEIRYIEIERFSCFNAVHFYNSIKEMNVQKGEKIKMNVTVGSYLNKNVFFTKNPTYSSFIKYYYFVNKDLKFEQTTNIEFTESLMQKEIELNLMTPPESGEYDLQISVVTGWLPPPFNSKKWRVSVK